jgi:hypothetical protein
VLVDIATARDTANNGMGRKEMIAMILEITLCGTTKAAENHYDYLVRKGQLALAAGGRVVTVQKTTTKRSQITIGQQIRFHATLDFAWEEAYLLNTPHELFKSLQKHFTGNLDETGILANGGILKVIGSMAKKKHEKIMDDARMSSPLCQGSTLAP